MKTKTAEEIMVDVRNMGNYGQFKLVQKLKSLFIDSNSENPDPLIDVHMELSSIKNDIQFISEKIGTYDMYINRPCKKN